MHELAGHLLSLECILLQSFRSLVVLAGAQLQPEDAVARFAELVTASEGWRARLLSHYEPFDNSYEYQAIMHAPGEGSAMVSWRPDDGLPWPLRGVQRWNMNEVVRVDGQSMTVDRVLSCLDFVWHGHVTRRVVDVALIEAEIQRRNLRVSTEELQSAMDQFWMRRRAFTDDATREWLDLQGMSEAALARHLEGEVATKKLKAEIAEGQHASYFERHRNDLEQVTIARATLAHQGNAKRLANANPGAFYLLAERMAVAGECELLLERRRRDELGAEERALLAAAPPPTVVGPIEKGALFTVVCLVESTPCEFDDVVIKAIEDRLFTAWLGERRREAEVAWAWGRLVVDGPRRDIAVEGRGET